jgi:DNA-binding FadR family transcriptional regulator
LHLPVPGKANEIIRDHQSIVKAIESADPGTAQSQLRDHLSRSLAYSAELRTQFPTYFRD